MSSRASAGRAPACAKTPICSLKATSVGMDRMPKAAAISCWSSVFTFPKTMSSWASLAASKTGPKALQGAHQGAQKSRRTIALSLIVFSRFSFVISMVAIYGSFSPLAGWPPRFGIP